MEKEILINFSIQLLKTGLRLNHIQETNFGYIGHYEMTEFCYLRASKLKYVRIQPLDKYKGKNITQSILSKNPEWRQIVTSQSEMDKSSVFPFTINDSIEYNHIKDIFNTKVSKLTNDFAMNSIEEGLAVLNIIGCTHDTKKAYCITPLFENDQSILSTLEQNRLPNCHNMSLLYAMEFRNFNSLKKNKNGYIYSPISEVNKMILASKIHRYKNFEINSRGTIKDSIKLETYYKDSIIDLCNTIFDDKRDPIQFYKFCRDFINLRGFEYKPQMIFDVTDINSLTYKPEIGPKPKFDNLVLNHQNLNHNMFGMKHIPKQHIMFP